MDPNHSFIANWLTMFHASSIFIQALWLLAISIIAVTAIQTVISIMRAIAGPPRGAIQGTVIYAIIQDPKGRWISYRQGQPPKEVSWTEVPAELRERGPWSSRSLQPPQD